MENNIQTLFKKIQLPSRSHHVYLQHSPEAEEHCIHILNSETTNNYA